MRVSFCGAGPECMRLWETMQVMAAALRERDDLDWSPAVLCCCKAVEVELERAVIRKWQGLVVAVGCKGADEVEGYLAKRSVKPPGLRMMAHFLRYVARRRIEPAYVFAINGKEFWRALWMLANALDVIAVLYRNRAVHSQRMTEWDFLFCENMVGGKNGVLDLVLSLDRRMLAYGPAGAINVGD